MLVFTPALVRGRDPALVLTEVLPWIDALQVRIKLAGSDRGPSPAAELYEWTARALDAAAAAGRRVPVIVNDRPDVALALAGRGCAGVHLGQDDFPPTEARDLLGPEALIGLSTHSAREVAAAHELPVSYLGFGPVFASRTKGARAPVGPEAAWIASRASVLPVFPIGGIDETNAAELAHVGRAAVSAAILSAADPASAARAIAAALAAD
jgi:thiamine-phosphate pyrophosphorylase